MEGTDKFYLQLLDFSVDFKIFFFKRKEDRRENER